MIWKGKSSLLEFNCFQEEATAHEAFACRQRAPGEDASSCCRGCQCGGSHRTFQSEVEIPSNTLYRATQLWLKSRKSSVNFNHFEKAGYDWECEASCRILIDYMIIACRHHVATVNRDPMEDGVVKPSNVTGDIGCTTPTSTRRPLQMNIFPEMDLSVEIDDNRTGKFKRIIVSGKADWAFAHGNRTDSGSGSVLIAVEAKNPTNFSQAYNELSTYLAIMRQPRKQEQKIVDYIQGFHSDGHNYQFMCISTDGKVLASKYYNIRWREDMEVVFNWILQMIDSAAKSSPNTKPGPEQENGLLDFETQVFLRLYDPQQDTDVYECSLDGMEIEEC
ncbi:hypothetical protein FN846DRAFT_25254 [Sphaerosporella brunnea]|uniref:Ig-like domain-containing protein n=1 Tax=Sphaerosporella brunnea TaxID=1250544 RepID=A0A5J5EUT3_9PEZI|nr:hypothetical protein FN846DRAFT_25254 [Sphaerosporella brunnea]